MHEFPIKAVLLEYSPTEKTVFVRYICADDKRIALAKVIEGNVQVWVRCYEGFDMVSRAPGFSNLVPAKPTKQL